MFLKGERWLVRKRIIAVDEKGADLEVIEVSGRHALAHIIWAGAPRPAGSRLTRDLFGWLLVAEFMRLAFALEGRTEIADDPNSEIVQRPPVCFAELAQSTGAKELAPANVFARPRPRIRRGHAGSVVRRVPNGAPRPSGAPFHRWGEAESTDAGGGDTRGGACRRRSEGQPRPRHWLRWR